MASGSRMESRVTWEGSPNPAGAASPVDWSHPRTQSRGRTQMAVLLIPGRRRSGGWTGPCQSPSSRTSPAECGGVMPFHFSSTGRAARPAGQRPSACPAQPRASQSLRSIRLLQHSACHPCPGGPKAVPRGRWHPHRRAQFHQASYRRGAETG